MMPKKLKPETPKEQGARFKREAQKLIDAGELNVIEAEKGMEDVLKPRRPFPN